MLKQYLALKEGLDLVNFSQIYPGFHRYSFSLYDEKKVIIDGKEQPYDERFIGNTTINYEGVQIAIWNMEYPVDDLQVFTSKLVHEMFHAYQTDQGETRFPNEFCGLSYRYTQDNLADKFFETKILIEAYLEASKEKFNIFLNLRHKRSENYKEEVNYESGIETIEGTARFVEINALSQLNKTKAEKEISRIINTLRNINQYIPIRKISYEVGALIQLTAEKLGIAYELNITGNKKSLFESFRLYPLQSISVSFDNKNIHEVISRHQNNCKLKIDKFFETNPTKISSGKIVGFDPMNTFKYENKYYFEYFVRISTESGEKNYFGTSCAVESDNPNEVNLFVKNG